MAFIAKSFYDLSAISLDGEKIDFNTFRGRAVLIENVASLWGTTTRDFTQLNELQCRFPRRLVVLGFPCNQFGHQVRGPLYCTQGVGLSSRLRGGEKDCACWSVWNQGHVLSTYVFSTCDYQGEVYIWFCLWVKTKDVDFIIFFIIVYGLPTMLNEGWFQVCFSLCCIISASDVEDTKYLLNEWMEEIKAQESKKDWTDSGDLRSS